MDTLTILKKLRDYASINTAKSETQDRDALKIHNSFISAIDQVIEEIQNEGT